MIFKGIDMVQLDTKAGCIMGWVLYSSDDHKSTLNSGQIHDVKYAKWKYYKKW